MKRILLFMAAISLMVNLSAQQVDYELVGFINSDGQVMNDWALGANEDLQPRVQLKNNGPDVPAASDVLVFVIKYNFDSIGTFSISGADLQDVLPGQTRTIELPQALFTAAAMDQYVMTAFRLCFEARLEGAATDANPENNETCVQIDRPLPVAEFDAQSFRVYPNPVTSVCNVECDGMMEGSSVVRVFDVMGKMVAATEVGSLSNAIDMSALAPGMYLLRVERDGAVVATVKVMKR